MSAGGPKIMNSIYYIDFCPIADTKKQCKLLKDGTFYPYPACVKQNDLKIHKRSLHSTKIKTISTVNIFYEMLHQQVMNDEGNKKTNKHGPHDAGKTKKALLIYSAWKNC